VSILLVDIGNTRVKWARLRLGRVSPDLPIMGRGGAIAHQGRPAAMAALLRRAPQDVERVVAVSVAGRKLDSALAAAVRKRFGLRVEFVASSREAGGVTNGYRDTWRLGADRWVAAIGAHAIARTRPVLLAMAGTALTIDLVSATGRHRGGAIIPGPAAMVASLLSGTHGIRRRAGRLRAQDLHDKGRRLFADNTGSALAGGAHFAAAAFIDRAYLEATRTLGARPLLLLGGGGAPALRRHLRSPVRVLPDLVLHGLAALAMAR
jgi:type III pantothenate kinase